MIKSNLASRVHSKVVPCPKYVACFGQALLSVAQGAQNSSLNAICRRLRHFIMAQSAASAANHISKSASPTIWKSKPD